MLLSVHSALHTDPQGVFYIHDTTDVSAAQPMDALDEPAPGILAMFTHLTAPQFDAWNNRTLPAGTLVAAPVRYVQAQAGFEHRPFVYMAHDSDALRDTAEAYFYLPDELERLVTAEYGDPLGYGGALQFDPITFGTGEVAELYHPASAAPADAAKRQAAFNRARGPRLAAKEALLTTFRARVLMDPAPPADTVVRVFHSTAELACIEARLRNELAGLQRLSSQGIPAVGAVSSGLLPRGALIDACLEGQVVQSPAAWSVRIDPRVHAVLPRAAGHLPWSLPLVCTTTDNSVHQMTSRAWLVWAGASRNPRGVLALSPNVPLWLWTVDPDSASVARDLTLSSAHVTALPVWAQWMTPASVRVGVRIAGDLARCILQHDGTPARLALGLSGGQTLVVRYTPCPPGSLALYDNAVSQFDVCLPPADLVAADALRIGLHVSSDGYTAREHPDHALRVRDGRAEEVSPSGSAFMLPESGERYRLSKLLPVENSDETVVSLQFGLPHVYGNLSAHLRRELNPTGS